MTGSLAARESGETSPPPPSPRSVPEEWSAAVAEVLGEILGDFEARNPWVLRCTRSEPFRGGICAGTLPGDSDQYDPGATEGSGRPGAIATVQ